MGVGVEQAVAGVIVVMTGVALTRVARALAVPRRGPVRVTIMVMVTVVMVTVVMPGMSMLMAVATVAVLGIRIAVHFIEYKSFGLAHCV